MRLNDLFESVLRQDALTIALVHGACVAGGCGLATAHDFVVAAEDARFLYSEVRIGFVAALVATYLPLRLRGSDIRELLLNPQFVDAAQGAGDRPGQPGRPRARTSRAVGEALAAQILETGSSESIARTKRLLLDVLGRPLGDALDPGRRGQRRRPRHRRLQARHRHLPGDQEAAEVAVRPRR